MKNSSNEIASAVLTASLLLLPFNTLAQGQPYDNSAHMYDTQRAGELAETINPSNSRPSIFHMDKNPATTAIVFANVDNDGGALKTFPVSTVSQCRELAISIVATEEMQSSVDCIDEEGEILIRFRCASIDRVPLNHFPQAAFCDGSGTKPQRFNLKAPLVDGQTPVIK